MQLIFPHTTNNLYIRQAPHYAISSLRRDCPHDTDVVTTSYKVSVRTSAIPSITILTIRGNRKPVVSFYTCSNIFRLIAGKHNREKLFVQSERVDCKGPMGNGIVRRWRCGSLVTQRPQSPTQSPLPVVNIVSLRGEWQRPLPWLLSMTYQLLLSMT